MSHMKPELVFGRWSRYVEDDEGEWVPETDGPTEGWGGRLSAPGYLDATPWVVCQSQDEVREQLAWLHDLCPNCLREDCDCDSPIREMKEAIDDG